MTLDLLWLVIGFVGLIVGGDLLVRGASGIAVAMKVPPLVIGLTIVAFGTSAPEFAVTASSSLSGQTDLAMGNVLGSCIFNVLFILGISALVAPLVVSARLVWLEVPLMLGSVVALLLMSLDGTLGRVEGGLLFASLLIYTGWLLIQSRKEPPKIRDEFTDIPPEPSPTRRPREILIDVGLLLGGLALLVFGSNWTVEASTSIARQVRHFRIDHRADDRVGWDVVAGSRDVSDGQRPRRAGHRGRQCRGQQLVQRAGSRRAGRAGLARGHRDLASRAEFRHPRDDCRVSCLPADLFHAPHHRSLGGRVAVRVLRWLHDVPDTYRDRQ